MATSQKPPTPHPATQKSTGFRDRIRAFHKILIKLIPILAYFLEVAARRKKLTKRRNSGDQTHREAQL